MSRRDSRLDERVARLERMVEQIHARLGLPPEPPPRPAPPPERPPRTEAWAHLSEQWLGRVGLALLFLGLVYLFDYSILQGWITPPVRVAVGLAIGSVLLFIGLRTRHTRRSFSQLLLAGSVAVFYVTGFAAYLLYALVSYGVAFLFLTGVMALAVVLAGRQERPSLASIGALGGLATPLLLHRQSPAVVELAGYAVLVVGWAGVLYWRRGWLTLLWTYAVGGLATLGVAASHAMDGNRWIVGAALLFTWVLAAAVPFVRGVWRPNVAHGLRRNWRVVPLSIQLRLLGVGATTAVVSLAAWMWSLSQTAVGVGFLLFAAAYGGFAWVATGGEHTEGRAAAPVAAALCATGALLVLHGAAQVAIASALALLYLYAGSRRRFGGVGWVGHTLFGLLGLLFLAESSEVPRVAFDAVAWAQLLEIVGMVVGAAWVRPRTAAWGYRLAAHALFLGWLAKEFGALPLGTGAVTLAWGGYGAVLLLLALRWRSREGSAALQMVAFSALGLAVLKLLFVDLHRVAMFWRILFFLGFGGVLLGLSSLFKPGGRDERWTQ